ncbi:MAG: hypothetical protein ACRDFS_01860 [Chloroflexota bacterium]
MKIPLVAAAAVALLAASGYAGAGAAAHRPAPLRHVALQRLGSSSLLHPWHLRFSAPLQTGATPTPTATGTTTSTTSTPTATPSPTATVSVTPSPTATTTPTYPDPVTLLNNTFNVYSEIRRVHYDQYERLEQTGLVQIYVDWSGDAVCHKNAFIAHVNAKTVEEGLNQTKHLKFTVIKVGSQYYKRANQSKKWSKIKAKAAAAYGVGLSTPLECPSSSSGSSSGPQEVVKKITTAGPAKFRGVAVWHVHASAVIKSQGHKYPESVDYLISQKHFLPYKITAKIVDSADKVTITEGQVLTLFGEKVTIKAPVINSNKPAKHSKKPTKHKKH